jgi:ABC-type glutathione transport system ATPase component
MSTEAAIPKSKQPVIQCDSVYKIFGENAKRVLANANGVADTIAFQEAGCVVGVNNASFEVHTGELLVIMGLSGSGKSTLLRCISRLTDPTAGRILIEGKDILSMTSKQLIELRRDKMGMVKHRISAAGQREQYSGQHRSGEGDGRSCQPGRERELLSPATFRRAATARWHRSLARRRT